MHQMVVTDPRKYRPTVGSVRFAVPQFDPDH
jgi:hypothetical protein